MDCFVRLLFLLEMLFCIKMLISGIFHVTDATSVVTSTTSLILIQIANNYLSISVPPYKVLSNKWFPTTCGAKRAVLELSGIKYKCEGADQLSYREHN